MAYPANRDINVVRCVSSLLNRDLIDYVYTWKRTRARDHARNDMRLCARDSLAVLFFSSLVNINLRRAFAATVISFPLRGRLMGMK